MINRTFLLLLVCVIVASCAPRQGQSTGNQTPQEQQLVESMADCIPFYAVYAESLRPTDPGLAQQFDNFAAPNMPVAIVSEMNILHRGIDFRQQSQAERERLYATGIQQGAQQTQVRVQKWRNFFAQQPDSLQLTSMMVRCNAVSSHINEVSARMRQDPVYAPLYRHVTHP